MIFILFLKFGALAQKQEPEAGWWMSDGNISAIAKDDAHNLLYIGGSFTALYPRLPYGSKVDLSTGVPDFSVVKPNGSVTAVIPDGGGGWYIGGSFTMVDGQARNNLAHISVNGKLTSWDPALTGTFFSSVSCLLKKGSTIYIGGSFTSVGGQPRNNLAAVSSSTGQVTSWNPGAGGLFDEVSAMAVNGSTLYVGGNFSTVGGQPRNYLAAVSTGTGLATAWNPDADGFIRAMVISGNTLYAAGYFTTIGGQPRQNLATVSLTTGAPGPWSPSADDIVTSLAISGNTVYAGGAFNNIGGQARGRLAALNAVTGLATSWNPGPDGALVTTIALSGGKIYTGGQFTTIGGQARNRVAAIDSASGLATGWAPEANNSVNIIGIDGGKAYIGGDFTGIGGKSRNNIAALDAATGAPVSWNPGADNAVTAFAFSGNTVYVGGSFTNIGGQARNKIAAIDATTGLADSWNPNANNTVLSLVTDGSTVYAGGTFTTIGGQTRNRIVALNITTGLATAWDPNASGTVNCIVLDGGLVYASGSFTTIGGQTRNRIAALNSNSGLAAAWNPNAGGAVNVIVKDGNLMYAGGSFTTIGGQSRNRIAALDLSTGLATAWNPNAGSTVSALALAGSTVYAGGAFSSIGGQSRDRLAALDASTGLATAWDPGSNSTVARLVAGGSTIYTGGSFSLMGGLPQEHLAVFFSCTKAATKPLAIQQTGGATKVCPGESRTFSIDPVPGADVYNWIAPAGATITSGQGTVSVAVSFDGAFGASDIIQVNAQNDCGSSAYRTRTILKGTSVATPSVITGDKTGVCGGTGVPYSILDVPGTTYTWAFDNANATVASGQGSSLITAGFDPSYTTGTLSVTAVNGCGTSSPRKLAIKAKPDVPAAISGPAAACPGQTGVAYSVPPVSGATSYSWVAPSGAHVSDGTVTSSGNSLTTTSTSVTVNFGSSSGDVKLRANNNCGYSGYSSLTVTLSCGSPRMAGGLVDEDAMTVYPNPVSGSASISFRSDKAGIAALALFDMTGKKLLEQNLMINEGTNHTVLNTSTLLNGVYQLILQGAGAEQKLRLVIEQQ